LALVRLRVVYADVDEPNAASRGLLTKLGVQPVAGTPTQFRLTPTLLRP
jgi:RimJ/RimL family protein N-acetyltransferase